MAFDLNDLIWRHILGLPAFTQKGICTRIKFNSLVLRLEYSGETPRSTHWLLIWFLTSPAHEQPRYRLHGIAVIVKILSPNQSEIFASDRWLIDIELRVFALWDGFASFMRNQFNYLCHLKNCIVQNTPEILENPIHAVFPSMSISYICNVSRRVTPSSNLWLVKGWLESN